MSKNQRPFFAHYAKIFRNEFKGYNSKALLNDATAGITVGAVALPLALAFGAASVDAEHAAIGIAGGLITAILAGIISGLLGGGSFQISGPTGAMAVILGTIVSGTYGMQGMFMATFMLGTGSPNQTIYGLNWLPSLALSPIAISLSKGRTSIQSVFSLS